MDNQNTTFQSVDEQMPPFMPARHHRNRTWLLAVIAVVVLLAAAAMVLPKLTKPNPVATVKLSNGKEVALGQSARAVAAAVGSGRLNGAPDTLEYPAKVDLEHPLQATFYLQQGKLAAIRVNRKDNVQKTGVYVGMKVDDLKAMFGERAKLTHEQVAHGTARGWLVEDKNVNSYYLINPCAPNPDRVVVMIIALKGQEAKAKELGAGCNNRGT